MITLGLEQPPTICSDRPIEPAPSKFLQASWRLVLVAAFIFGEINHIVINVTKERPWLWSLAIAAGLLVMGALDKLVLRLYMQYAPAIFDRDPPQERTARDEA
jgi:hypothetical protein